MKLDSYLIRNPKSFVTKDGRLIIFIDDLDRCLPEHAITVLESLKLYLDNSRCVFIFGMDRKIIELGIKKRYGKEINISGNEYLEKIIQMPFFIPPIQFLKLKESFEKITKTEGYTSQIWKILENGINGNPRKGKRFINSFYMVRKVIENQELIMDEWDLSDDPLKGISEEIKLFYIAKVLIIQMMYPKFYDFLIFYPDGWQKYEYEILEKNSPEESETLSKYEGFKDLIADKDIKKFMLNTAENPNEGIPIPPNELIMKRIIQLAGLLESKKPKTEYPFVGPVGYPTSGATPTPYSGEQSTTSN